MTQSIADNLQFLSGCSPIRKQWRIRIQEASHVFGQSGIGGNACKFFDGSGGTHDRILPPLLMIQSNKMETFHRDTKPSRGALGMERRWCEPDTSA